MFSVYVFVKKKVSSTTCTTRYGLSDLPSTMSYYSMLLYKSPFLIEKKKDAQEMDLFLGPAIGWEFSGHASHAFMMQLKNDSTNGFCKDLWESILPGIDSVGKHK